MWDLQGLTMPNYQPFWGCYKPSQESGLLKLLSPSGSNMPFLMLGQIGGFTKDAIAYYKKSNMATRMCNSHTPLSCLTLHPQTTFPSAFHQNNTHKTKPTENNRHRSQSSHYTDHNEKQTTTTSQQKHWVWSHCPLAYVCCQPTSKQCCFPWCPYGWLTIYSHPLITDNDAITKSMIVNGTVINRRSHTNPFPQNFVVLQLVTGMSGFYQNGP